MFLSEESGKVFYSGDFKEDSGNQNKSTGIRSINKINGSDVRIKDIFSMGDMTILLTEEDNSPYKAPSKKEQILNYGKIDSYTDIPDSISESFFISG